MGNIAVSAIAWIGFLAHLVVGILIGRRMADIRLLPLLNLATAGFVLAYWVNRWYGYVAHGVTWYASDQLLPLFALVVFVLAAMAVWGRGPGTIQWLFLAVDGVALLGAALMLSMLRFGRLM